MKVTLNSTVDHQVKAVHDVALLSKVVDAIKAELDKVNLHLRKYLTDVAPQ